MDRYSDTSSETWRVKGAKFVRYLTTRPVECWGFFAAGAVLAKIFL